MFDGNVCLTRNQEEESLKAAIALSRQETLPQEEETEPEEPQNDLLLDFSTTGMSSCNCINENTFTFSLII